MKLLFISLLLAAGSCVAQTVEESPVPSSTMATEKPADTEEYIFTFVDEEPVFPGGHNAMMDFCKKNTHYPESAKAKRIDRKCFLKFAVDRDGSIFKVEVDRGVPDCPECDQEAIRVVKSMPKWKPAKNNGQIVRCYFTLPISFTDYLKP